MVLSMFSINHPILGGRNFDPYPFVSEISCANCGLMNNDHLGFRQQKLRGYKQHT